MARFQLLILIGYASFANAQFVNTVVSSPVNVEVTDVTGKDFTLKTCGSAWMILSRNNITYPKYEIHIFPESGDMPISAFMAKMEEGDDVTYSVSSVLKNASICDTPGAFWLSWGGGLLRFGKGTFGSNAIMEMDISDHVESFIIESGAEATWQFVNNAVPTSSVQTTTNMPTPANDCNGKDTQLPSDVPTTEPETDTGSKYFSLDSCYLGRVLTILIILWAVIFIS